MDSQRAEIELVLPFPPSVNTLHSVYRGRKILSAKGRAYKKEALKKIAKIGVGPFEGDLKVHILLQLPDNRRRDVDNYSKAILDCLTEGKLIQDDACIRELTITKDGPVKYKGKNLKGFAVIKIQELEI